MINKKDIPDLSDLNHKTINTYIVASLAGVVQKKGPKFDRAVGSACRLIDKAKEEYNNARYFIGEEEKERKMTYEKIIERDEGQYMYTVSIINHFENCINAVARVHKLLPFFSKINKSNQIKSIADIRNTIEHIEERINRDVKGPLAPYIWDDDLAVRVDGSSIKIKDLASEIRRLHAEILSAIL